MNWKAYKNNLASVEEGEYAGQVVMIDREVGCDILLVTTSSDETLVIPAEYLRVWRKVDKFLA